MIFGLLKIMQEPMIFNILDLFIILQMIKIQGILIILGIHEIDT